MSDRLPASARRPQPPDACAPRFVIGQDGLGRWVAVEIHGRAGGLFRSRAAALHYAVDATAHRPDAVSIAPGRVELRL